MRLYSLGALSKANTSQVNGEAKSFLSPHLRLFLHWDANTEVQWRISPGQRVLVLTGARQTNYAVQSELDRFLTAPLSGVYSGFDVGFGALFCVEVEP